jgi:hypothetical protein
MIYCFLSKTRRKTEKVFDNRKKMEKVLKEFETQAKTHSIAFEKCAKRKTKPEEVINPQFDISIEEIALITDENSLHEEPAAPSFTSRSMRWIRRRAANVYQEASIATRIYVLGPLRRRRLARFLNQRKRQ